MTSLSEQADQALSKGQCGINPRWYPRYHLAPRAGWMNDPNGLVWFDGWYHTFYQHHPYSPEWGPMHWGHARSKDLVHWEHLPIALAPEGAADKDGCFSGSAVVDNDTLVLIYTGHKYHGPADTDSNLYQVQCLASSCDGIHFKRHGLVIDTPNGLHHFRDPKVWREGEVWYMVVGSRQGNTGQVRLYRSADLHEWQAEGILAEAAENEGYMWECPDLFTLGGKRVLMFSPQGMAGEGYRCRNLFQSGYLVGDWEPGQPFTHTGKFTELDHGHDFYAPQSFMTPDGRRIVIGWLDMWESPMPERQDGWAGMLSLPREISLGDDHRVRMKPALEVTALRGHYHSTSVSRLNNQHVQMASDAVTTEIKLAWNLSASTAEQYGLSLGSGLRIYVDDQAGRLVLERRYPEFSLEGTRSIPLPAESILTLQVFIDCSSVEIFVNEGYACLSSRIYPQPGQRVLSLFAHQGTALLQEAGYWCL
ncbi:glycoside hydrolase family 32 protein [Pantoea deleyi]|uniref:glycoside hydrolase family 32 protein n=1 Tax=Pantoea deleyi TaxID=470932 RepID=UPI0035D49109